MNEIPYPFVYEDGKRCTGHIIRVKAYKADLGWSEDEDGTWTLRTGLPRSHFHLVCSEKSNHSGCGLPDDERMKAYLDQLPQGLWEATKRAKLA